MICKNCGGNYAVSELKCTFCGTPNSEGAARLEEKKRRLDLFHAVRLETILNAGPVVVTKVLTRMIWVFAGLFVISLISLLLIFMLSDLEREIAQEDLLIHTSYLKDLKSSEDYHKIAYYLGNQNVSQYNEGLEAYAMVIDMHRDLLGFRVNQDEIRRLVAEEIQDNEPSIKSMIRYACRIAQYPKNHYSYKAYFGTNQEVYEDFIEEVRIGLMLNLKLSSEEVEALFAADNFDNDHYEAFSSLAIERMMNHAASK